MIAIYQPTACNTGPRGVHWGGFVGGVTTQNVLVCTSPPKSNGSTNKSEIYCLGPQIHHYLYSYMADDGEPWDPEALERLLLLEADLAALLAFLAPRGPSGDTRPPKALAGPSSNLDRS